MKTIDKTYKIKAPIESVWQALTDAKLIEEWEAGPAKFEATEDGKFSLWGGDIHGTNTKIIENKLLQQDWFSRGNGNKEICYKVTFKLSSDGESTIVHLIHENVPENEYEDFVDGWKVYYIDPIKKILEN